jgi:hypothetical protein
MEQTPRSPGAVAVDSAPAWVLPELSASDEFVRDRLQPDRDPLDTAAGVTLPADWLGREDLLRRLAVVVENATRGEIPRRQLSFLAPDGKFQVREVAGVTPEAEPTLFIDPVSYARYDRYLDMLESVSPETVATLLTDTEPLLVQALGELGNSEAPVTQVRAAIDQVLAVPVIRDDIELIQPKVFFEYADPALEELPPLQKQVLRMGPDNLTRLQAYLSRLRDNLPPG